MVKVFTNREVARLLLEVAAAYEVKGDSFFQARSYDTAADSVEQAPVLVKDLWEQDRLQSLPGIGGSIAQHLDELFRTGKVKHFNWVKKGLPKGMFQFLNVPGVGPKNAYKLAKELGLETIADLQEACLTGKVAKLEGFGDLSQEKVLRGIEQMLRQGSQRIFLPVADGIAQRIVQRLREIPQVKRVDTLGSLRRMVTTIGDIDLAVQSDEPVAIIDIFTSLPEVKEILNKGKVKASVRLNDGAQVDLRVQQDKSYGALLQYFTGSKSHNIRLRELALNKKLSLSEYGIKKGGPRGELVEFASEEEFYHYLNLPWIPPEIREDAGEIEAALDNKLPQLVESSDIKGDLHVHCDFNLEQSHDRGLMAMPEIVKRGVELGYKYIAIGNHSPSVSKHTQTDMRKLLLKRQAEIERVQGNFPQIKLLSMVEVDILADDNLALNNENLKLLDVAIAAVHSSFQMSRDRMTQRVIKALKNPYVHGLAHPTGRLINEREGYELDWERIFSVCRENDKFLEVNSFCKRLDLPDLLVREAVRAGVKLAINTDAHSFEHLDSMKYGVAVARRGWAEKKDVVNTLNSFP
ncbi:DNA polymerase/3'-5' exonuclease PolX [Patescibacteria group bacterium]|nr:DNA polymerase/3'-5' exonuclease PolX [Patescibacteria group bacterium]MBU1868742.1 DNA polymerase/3'-5' exonuclease PolX [Patescibacteria group bacterium]